MKHKKTLIAFLIVATFIFLRVGIALYNDTKEMYDHNSFKEEFKVEYEKNPEIFQKEFGISSIEDITDEKVDKLISLSEKYRYLFIGVTSLFVSLIGTTLLFIPVFIILSIRKKYHKYRLSSDEFKTNKEYYRDLLKGYTPLELSYNNNYQIDNYAVIATILNMENKKIIEYKDNKFSVLNEGKNLSNIEKNIIHNIENNKGNFLEVSKSSLYNVTTAECKNKNLISLGRVSRKRFFLDLIISILIYGLVYLLWSKSDLLFSGSSIENSYFIQLVEPFITIVIYLFIFLYPAYFIFKYLILYFITGINNYKKTDLGNEINNKLEGLKNFIRDFSILNERDKKEVVIWDDYLVYSVMFGDNEKIMNQYNHSVKIKL